MTRVLIAGNWIDFDLIEQIAEALNQETGAIINILKKTFDRDGKDHRVVVVGDGMGQSVRNIASAMARDMIASGIELLDDDKNKEFTPIFDFGLDIPIMPRRPIRFPDPLSWPNYSYSYHPNHGEPCDHLWVDPSDIHDQLFTLAGYFMVLFHRKCFMQLKCFVNLRF